MNRFTEKLKAFLHDPIDKCLDIQGHENRAKEYAEKVGVTGIEEIRSPDWIASRMERSILERKVIVQNFNEIRHPLSEGAIKIENIDKSEVFQIVEKTFEEIGSEIKGQSDEYKFFYLWRNLLEKLLEYSKDKEWSKYLPLFPADTRVPDHSIWEHLKITSAINADIDGGEVIQNNSLFLFTIGPVQSFIAQARKTRDFYMGSFILSYFTFIGIKTIINKYGPTAIIYPDLFRQPLIDWFLEREKNIQVLNSNKEYIDTPTIPNRFVTLIPESNKEKIKALAEEIKKNICEEKDKILQTILEELEIETKGILEKICKQLKDFPEVYWVAIPWRKDNEDIKIKDLSDFFEENKIKAWENFWSSVGQMEVYKPNIGLLYQLLYTALEKSLRSRKNLRIFDQVLEEGRKCSICGERGVIFFRERENKDKFIRFNPDAKDLTDNEKVRPKHLSDGEGLCSLCFIKRTFDVYLTKQVSEKFEDFSFPSTAEVAIADFKEKVCESEEFKKYEEKLKEILKCPKVSPLPKLKSKISETVDGEFFFIENLNKKTIKEELEVDISDDELEELQKHLKNLTEKYGNPNPYYALIYLDGDDMGKWLSGEKVPNVEHAYNSQVWNNELGDDFKKRLSKTLEFNEGRKLLSPAIHASISTALRNYSIEFVRKIVEEEHLGKLIYAGGDDVLAFVNLKDLFDVMHKLRWGFSGYITIDDDGNIQVDFKNDNGFVLKNGQYILTMGPRATASMGVVIAHYKYPFQFVIKKAFEMAKYAKDKPGKDSFAILLIKHSGNEKRFIAKWKFNKTGNETEDTIALLKYLSKEVFNSEKPYYISKSFIRKLSDSFKGLRNEKGYITIGSGIFRVELKRLLERSFRSDKTSKAKGEFIEKVSEKMSQFFIYSDGIAKNLDSFINALEIAIFVGGKGNEVD